MPWDANAKGLHVRLIANPGRHGTTTGRTRTAGSFRLVEVDFGPNERQFKRHHLLEPVKPQEDMTDLLTKGRCGGPIDLRRILTLAKIKGDLTNVFYSMEASNTDFYPHQFKPVLKFVESTVGRMLIADEVGLGKTIEALYIWKELQARDDARRLLIIVPSMLRHKWRDDLQQRFGISADIIGARDLVEKIEHISRRQLINEAFVYITSIEGLRTPRDFHDDTKTSPRARFARFLDQNTATTDLALFDLTIIDEAHYLRNPQTASHRLGRLVRDASRNLVLLTATPIQIETGNLYQLLRLVDEEQFFQAGLFDEMLQANAPIIRALRSLWRVPPDMDAAREAVSAALANHYFANDPVLDRVLERMSDATNDPAARVELGRLLESRSLLGHYMTRSRKREVLERRVERASQTLRVSFHDLERSVYNTITQQIRERMADTQGTAAFVLCMRQRQMASCLVAALQRWRDWDLLDEVMWEDLGSLSRQNDIPAGDVDMTDLFSDNIVAGVDVRELERVDSKYGKLLAFLRRTQSERAADGLPPATSRRRMRSAAPKVVIFSFFRGTLTYLRRRLEQDGVWTAVIMGRMGDEKHDELRRFASASGPSVLLSSEVGSEGIDLQFCRLMVNYDLPWNPMKVEQRIGRLDRLGQTADKISIVNLALQDTIEDRILLRLYDRIDLFRNSIGDLEDILGEVTEHLMIRLLAPSLTDEERDQIASESEQAIVNRRKEQERLEREAVNLIGFTDHILDSIRDSRDQGHWLSGDELMALVDDFFERAYPGTQLTRLTRRPREPKAMRISLSGEARRALDYFIRTKRPPKSTRLHQRTSKCLFDPRHPAEVEPGIERIDTTHPLMQWIVSSLNDADVLYRVSAIDVIPNRLNIRPGLYTFVVHKWYFSGLSARRLLSFRAADLENSEVLNGKSSEELVVMASRFGATLPNFTHTIGDLDLRTAIELCEKSLCSEYALLLEDFEAENRQRCSAQETSATRFSERRISELGDRLRRFRDNNQRHLVPMTEGLLQRERAQLEAKLQRVAGRRNIDESMETLAVGIVRVC